MNLRNQTMAKAERAVLEAVAERFPRAGKRTALSVVRVNDVPEPRLRFDRVAIGFVQRLRAALSESVPEGRTVVVTITAPIWKDSKTAAALEPEIRKLLAARRSKLEIALHRNRIQVRVLKGGVATTPKLLGFVHNPDPGPAVLFELTSSVLACIGSGRNSSAAPVNDRWLVIANQDRPAFLGVVRHVCSALRLRTVFKKILVTHSSGRVAPLGL